MRAVELAARRGAARYSIPRVGTLSRRFEPAVAVPGQFCGGPPVVRRCSRSRSSAGRKSWPWALRLRVATDFADGRVARLRGEASRLGGFLDHAVDATFVVVGLAALAHAGLVPVALPPAIAAAFLQYALDSRIVSGGRLRASALGRWNGILYSVLLGVPVVRDGLGLGFPSTLVRVLGGSSSSRPRLVADRLLAPSTRKRAEGARDEPKATRRGVARPWGSAVAARYAR